MDIQKMRHIKNRSYMYYLLYVLKLFTVNGYISNLA